MSSPADLGDAAGISMMETAGRRHEPIISARLREARDLLHQVGMDLDAHLGSGAYALSADEQTLFNELRIVVSALKPKAGLGEPSGEARRGPSAPMLSGEELSEVVDQHLSRELRQAHGLLRKRRRRSCGGMAADDDDEDGNKAMRRSLRDDQLGPTKFPRHRGWYDGMAADDDGDRAMRHSLRDDQVGAANFRSLREDTMEAKPEPERVRGLQASLHVPSTIIKIKVAAIMCGVLSRRQSALRPHDLVSELDALQHRLAAVTAAVTLNHLATQLM